MIVLITVNYVNCMAPNIVENATCNWLRVLVRKKTILLSNNMNVYRRWRWELKPLPNGKFRLQVVLIMDFGLVLWISKKCVRMHQINLWPRRTLTCDLVGPWPLTFWPQSRQFHVVVPCTTCANWHRNQFIRFQNIMFTEHVVLDKKTRGQSNLTKSASLGAHSPVRGHPMGSKVVPLNSWGRVSY